MELDLVAPPTPREGTTVGGRYVLGALIGAGAMGAVYEAEHRWTHRRVAVKLLSPECSARADAVARFVQEARAAAAIEHPNIVAVLDFDRDDERTVFLVMEHLEGESLEAHLARVGVLSAEATVALLEPLLDALAHAHARGIVHRDVKPANIFLARGAGGTVVPKLLDFGVAKMMDGSGLAATRSGVLLGTPAYMAPEQGDGESTVDARVDVWSLGVVLYECLSGRLPYVFDSLQRLLVAVATTDAPPLSSVAPHVSPALASVVHRALARDPAARLATVLALRDALRDASGGAAPTPTPTPTPTPGHGRWLALVAAGLAVSALLGGELVRRGTPRANPRPDVASSAVSPRRRVVETPRTFRAEDGGAGRPAETTEAGVIAGSTPRARTVRRTRPSQQAEGATRAPAIPESIGLED